jgi:putative endonuclease
MNAFQKTSVSTKQRGDAAEDQALAYLQSQGLSLLVRNYRTPGRGGGEIDLIVRDHGGALASIGPVKQKRILLAARFYLQRLRHWPPCRFDVVVVEAGHMQWIQAAFSA